MAANKDSGRKSVINQRSDRNEIIKDLVLKRRSVIELANRLGVSTSSVMRFRKRYITEEVTRSVLAKHRMDGVQADTNIINEDRMDISRTYESLAKRVEKMITKAEANDDDAFALAAMEGLRKVLRDIASMQGKLAQSLTVNISLSESKEWVTLRKILNEVIDEVPAAREPLLRKMRYHVLSVTKEDDLGI